MAFQIQKASGIMTKRLLFFLAAVLVLAVPIVFGMATASPQAKTYRFEVASIRPTASGDDRQASSFGRGRYTATGQTLKPLIARAYGVQAFQVSGGPAWINSDRYNVDAKYEDALPRGPFANPQDDPFPPMLRGLLEDRFNLRAHLETKDMPIYLLVIAKNGPKIAQLNSDDASLPGSIRWGREELVASRVPMSFFVSYLSGQLNRLVVDKTNLAGQYDLQLRWTADQPLQLGRPDAGLASQPSIDPSAPSLANAMEEQMGLKLESGRGPVPIVVVESVEKPSEN